MIISVADTINVSNTTAVEITATIVTVLSSLSDSGAKKRKYHHN